MSEHFLQGCSSGLPGSQPELVQVETQLIAHCKENKRYYFKYSECAILRAAIRAHWLPNVFMLAKFHSVNYIWGEGASTDSYIPDRSKDESMLCVRSYKPS